MNIDRNIFSFPWEFCIFNTTKTSRFKYSMLLKNTFFSQISYGFFYKNMYLTSGLVLMIQTSNK